VAAGQIFPRIRVAFASISDKPLTNGATDGLTVGMHRPQFPFPDDSPLVVGSFGNIVAIAEATPETLAAQCDIAEIRLDLIHEELAAKGAAIWQHLCEFPLLFTARCHAEGSPYDLDAGRRAAMLRCALPDACLIDIEAASASTMAALISEIQAEGLPWIASYHDFGCMPSGQKLATHAEIAREAGATAFKVAARLRTIDDLSALIRFQTGGGALPLSTMGMGVLAPVSRLLCAQAGSVLNYGFVGGTATAPGQWSAAQLREGIRSLQPFR
jgi:3-dehydroquinate dehydratase-1